MWTFRCSVIEKMVEDARKNRALANNENEGQFVYIQKDLLNEIVNVLSQKSKHLYLILKQLRETLLFYLKSIQSFQENINPGRSIPLNLLNCHRRKKKRRKMKKIEFYIKLKVILQNNLILF